MKKTLVAVAILIFLALLGVGGYFLGRQMNFFLSDEEVLERSLEQSKTWQSFELKMNALMPDNEAEFRLTMKNIKASENQSRAIDLLLEMKNNETLSDAGAENPMPAELKLLNFILKNNKSYFQIGNFPLLALFGLGNLFDQWFYFDELEYEKLVADSSLLPETPLVEGDLKTKLQESQNIISNYFFNNHLFLVQEKLANTKFNNQTILNYKMALNKEALKEMMQELAALLSEEETTTDLDSMLDDFIAKMTDINLIIVKSNLELRELNFKFLVEDGKQIEFFFTFNNQNRLNLNDIMEPESAISIVDWIKYMKSEAQRSDLYNERINNLNKIAVVLNNKCEEFKALEAFEQAKIDALPEAEREGKSVENLVLSVSGDSLTLANLLDVYDEFANINLNDPAMPIDKNWPACSNNPTERCNYAFGNPEAAGAPFDFKMTYIDPCHYWLNYMDNDIAAYFTETEKSFSLFQERSFEEYLIEEGQMSVDSIDNNDAKRKKDINLIRSALNTACSQNIEISLNSSVFSSDYIPLSQANDISLIKFSSLNDPSAVTVPCANDASANCNYAFADPDANGEFLPLDLNEAGQVLIDPCHYRINYYLDEGGLFYTTENRAE